MSIFLELTAKTCGAYHAAPECMVVVAKDRSTSPARANFLPRDRNSEDPCCMLLAESGSLYLCYNSIRAYRPKCVSFSFVSL